MRIGEAIRSETAWGKTWNGADTLVTTFNKCLDMFGRAGAMRNADTEDKKQLFADGYEAFVLYKRYSWWIWGKTDFH